MATVSVYYCKGAINKDLVTSVFVDPAFEINEADFSSDKASCDSRLNGALAHAKTEQGWKTFVFLRKLDAKGRVQATKFANDVLANGDNKTLFVEDADFSAVSIPRAQAAKIQGELERGGAIFDPSGYSSLTGGCMLVNRNVMFVLIIIAVTILIILAPYVKTKTGLFLMVAAIVFIIFWALMFSM